MLHMNESWSYIIGSIGSGLVGYLVWTNITTFTHGTYKIDPGKTNDAWQVWMSHVKRE